MGVVMLLSRLLLVVFTLAISSLTMSVVTQARDRCGAIAWSKNDAGFTGQRGHENCDKAELAALKDCQQNTKGDCVISIVCKNSCCALAVGDTGSNGAIGSSEETAKQSALAACRAKRQGCALKHSFCSFGDAVKHD